MQYLAVPRVVQQSGVMALEPHFENPHESAIVSKYPKFLGRHHAVDFLADSVKVIIGGGIAPHDLEALMDEDLHVHHEEALRPAGALAKVADALPGLGIVAAVLGVVITMQAIDGPPSEIGHKVGAALVGTFLGILMSYGFVQPMSANIEASLTDEGRYDAVPEGGAAGQLQGFCAGHRGGVRAPRRIADDMRPGFEEDRASTARARRTIRRRRRHVLVWRSTISPSSSSRSTGADTAAITAAPGRWPTPTS